VVPRDREAPARGGAGQSGCRRRPRRLSHRRPGKGSGESRWGSGAQPREGSPRAASRRCHGWCSRTSGVDGL
jgi:hypothetical protein